MRVQQFPFLIINFKLVVSTVAVKKKSACVIGEVQEIFLSWKLEEKCDIYKDKCERFCDIITQQ